MSQDSLQTRHVSRDSITDNCCLYKPGIERVQALADISRSRYVVNETRALIANLPNSGGSGHHYHSPKLHPGPCSSVGMQQQTDRHTDRRA